MSTLQERIQEVIDSGHKQADLARMTGKSSAAVTLWVSGQTKTIKGKNALAIENGTARKVF